VTAKQGEAHTRPGPLALVGSGEYLEAMAGLEAELIKDRAPRYVQLATAAAPEGEHRLAYWHELGRAQAIRLGVEPVIVPVHDRTDANNPEFADMVRGAGLIYLSGGDPGYLADTLRDTTVWRAIVETWGGGAALAGCSAGAMAMASWIPSLRHPRRGHTAGLGLLPHLRVVPHFDYFRRAIPHVLDHFLAPRDGTTLVGIDEETALVGGPDEWRVAGRQAAWIITGEQRTAHHPGSVLRTPR